MFTVTKELEQFISRTKVLGKDKPYPYIRIISSPETVRFLCSDNKRVTAMLELPSEASQEEADTVLDVKALLKFAKAAKGQMVSVQKDKILTVGGKGTMSINVPENIVDNAIPETPDGDNYGNIVTVSKFKEVFEWLYKNTSDDYTREFLHGMAFLPNGRVYASDRFMLAKCNIKGDVALPGKKDASVVWKGGLHIATRLAGKRDRVTLCLSEERSKVSIDKGAGVSIVVWSAVMNQKFPDVTKLSPAEENYFEADDQGERSTIKIDLSTLERALKNISKIADKGQEKTKIDLAKGEISYASEDGLEASYPLEIEGNVSKSFYVSYLRLGVGLSAPFLTGESDVRMMVFDRDNTVITLLPPEHDEYFCVMPMGGDV